MSNFQPSFTVSRPAQRIRFGAGSAAFLTEEAGRLRAERVLVVTSEGGRRHMDRIAETLGRAAAGGFHGALPHGPEEVKRAALAAADAARADALVAVGGGTAIGLGKILSARTRLPLIALPTTYSGVESAPGLEESRDGVTLRHDTDGGLPGCLIYDPDLSRDLPWGVTLSTTMTALSHAVAGLCAPGRTPLSRLTAKEALWIIALALPSLRDTPDAAQARAELLYAAWLAGLSRGAGARTDHQRLVDALSGARGLPEARVHGVLLPHTVAAAERAAGPLLDPVRDVFGAPAGEGIRDFTQALGVPESLAALGLEAADLDRAADLAASVPGEGETASRGALRVLLEAAWDGSAPGSVDESAGQPIAGARI